jgi:acetyl esterase/lipase
MPLLKRFIHKILFGLLVCASCCDADERESMSSKSILIWPEKPLVTPDREVIKDQRVYFVDNPSITPFFPEKEKSNGTSIIIFPGGGYVRLAVLHEAFEIAKWFTERGITVFVVKYRMQEYGYPAPLLDGLRAVRIVRSRAADWNIDPNKIGVLGFSAGGHVAASVLTRSDFVTKDADSLAKVSAKPDFAVLGYPVISMQATYAHQGSRKALLGENPSTELLSENSLELQVKKDVSPVFIFHGIADQAVPVANSLVFFNEVQKYNANSELHIYQSSIHGLGMIQGQGSISSWPQALDLWLKQNKWID